MSDHSATVSDSRLKVDQIRGARGLMQVAHILTRALSERATFQNAVAAIGLLTSADHVGFKRFDIASQGIDIIATLNGAGGLLDVSSAQAISDLPVGAIVPLEHDRGRAKAVLLGLGQGYADIMVITARDETWLPLLAEELPVIWAARSKGMISMLIASQHMDDTDEALLSPQNPYGLTRAETQICIRLADGLKPKEIAERLGCSMPTVRTHLRNIYAKTELDGLVGVVHRLYADETK